MPDPEAVREVAGRWLAMAADDLGAARLLLASTDIGAEVAGFHAQQAAEKALKAMLVAAAADVPRTHDLDRLHSLVCEAVGDERIELPGGDDLAWLTQLGLGGRYPDGTMSTESDRADVQRAIDLASIIVAAARGALGAK